jgi:large subunit ribosomal protein L24
MARSLTIHKGDKVRIIAGKDKGKDGKVLRSYPFKERVMVEGANLSNVMLVCPNCTEPTRVGRRREAGTRVRVCKKCGKDIDK